MSFVHALVQQYVAERARSVHADRPFQRAWDAHIFAFGPAKTHAAFDIQHSHSRTTRADRLVELGRDLTQADPDHIITSSRGTRSLLNLATAHLVWGSGTEGRMLIEKLRGEQWGEPQNTTTFFHSENWINPTYPEKFGLEKIETAPNTFNAGQLSWLDTPLTGAAWEYNAVDRCVVLHNLGLVHGDRWARVARARAATYLRNEGEARVPYDKLAAALSICRGNVRTSYLASATGARVALGVVYGEDSDLFRKGLRRLVVENIRKGLAPWVSRPLEMEDLVGISGLGLMQLLHDLPWEIVQPLARDHHAQVVPKTVEVLGLPAHREAHRRMLLDHDQRPQRQRLENKDPDAWENNMCPIIEKYKESREFRANALGDGVTPDEMMLALISQHEPHLKDVAEHSARWDVMKRFLRKCPEHIRKIS